MCADSNQDAVKPAARAEVAWFNAACVGARPVWACRQSAAVVCTLYKCQQATEPARLTAHCRGMLAWSSVFTYHSPSFSLMSIDDRVLGHLPLKCTVMNSRVCKICICICCRSVTWNKSKTELRELLGLEAASSVIRRDRPVPGFWNSSYPENLELFLEQETTAFSNSKISGYPRNNSPKVILALSAG